MPNFIKYMFYLCVVGTLVHTTKFELDCTSGV